MSWLSNFITSGISYNSPILLLFPLTNFLNHSIYLNFRINSWSLWFIKRLRTSIVFTILFRKSSFSLKFFNNFLTMKFQLIFLIFIKYQLFSIFQRFFLLFSQLQFYGVSFGFWLRFLRNDVFLWKFYFLNFLNDFLLVITDVFFKFLFGFYWNRNLTNRIYGKSLIWFFGKFWDGKGRVYIKNFTLNYFHFCNGTFVNWLSFLKNFFRRNFLLNRLWYFTNSHFTFIYITITHFF